MFPEWLGEDARPVWDRVSEELAALGLWFRADQDVIAGYVSSVTLFERAVRGLAEDGFASRNDHGRLHRSQWLMIRRDGLNGVAKFGSLLGLSPTARASLNIASPSSDYDELLDGPGRLLSH